MHRSLRHAIAIATSALALTAGSSAAFAAGSALGSPMKVNTDTVYADGDNLAAQALGVAQTGQLPRAGTPNVQTQDGRTDFSVYWVDADSFDLLIRADANAFQTFDIDTFTLTISQLVFMDAGQHVAVTGFSFNEAASDYTGYLQSFDNPTGAPRPSGPSLVITNSLMESRLDITMGGYAGQLIGDQAILRFDVQTAPVPEPATYGLMALGLGALAWRLQRRTPPQAT